MRARAYVCVCVRVHVRVRVWVCVIYNEFIKLENIFLIAFLNLHNYSIKRSFYSFSIMHFIVFIY